MAPPDLTLLMTRPRPASRRFVAGLPRVLRSRLRIFYAPLIEIALTASRIDPGPARGLIFTSANGVECAARLLPKRDLPCYCVGSATTQAARRAGWQANLSGATADELVRSLVQMRPDGPLLHICGAHTRGDVARRLTRAGVSTEALTVYDQRLVPFADEAQRLLDATDPVIVPLFSPRTARHFADLFKGHAPVYAAALSDAVAAPLRGLGLRAIEMAPRPDSASLIGAVEKLANLASRVEGGPGAQ